MEGDHYLPTTPDGLDARRSNSSGRDVLRWVTIESGVDPELCPIIGSEGSWVCKIHFKNLRVTPRTEEDQNDLLGGGTTRSMYWFEDCHIEGVVRNAGSDMTVKSGSRIWSIGTLLSLIHI